jgi:hypothetical protein
MIMFPKGVESLQVAMTFSATLMGDKLKDILGRLTPFMLSYGGWHVPRFQGGWRENILQFIV